MRILNMFGLSVFEELEMCFNNSILNSKILQ